MRFQWLIFNCIPLSGWFWNNGLWRILWDDDDLPLNHCGKIQNKSEQINIQTISITSSLVIPSKMPKYIGGEIWRAIIRLLKRKIHNDPKTSSHPTIPIRRDKNGWYWGHLARGSFTDIHLSICQACQSQTLDDRIGSPLSFQSIELHCKMGLDSSNF